MCSPTPPPTQVQGWAIPPAAALGVVQERVLTMFLVEELLTELHAIQVHYIQAIGLFFWHVGHTRPSKRLGGGEAVWRRSGNS